MPVNESEKKFARIVLPSDWEDVDETNPVWCHLQCWSSVRRQKVAYMLGANPTWGTCLDLGGFDTNRSFRCKPTSEGYWHIMHGGTGAPAHLLAIPKDAIVGHDAVLDFRTIVFFTVLKVAVFGSDGFAFLLISFLVDFIAGVLAGCGTPKAVKRAKFCERSAMLLLAISILMGMSGRLAIERESAIRVCPVGENRCFLHLFKEEYHCEVEDAFPDEANMGALRYYAVQRGHMLSDDKFSLIVKTGGTHIEKAVDGFTALELLSNNHPIDDDEIIGLDTVSVEDSDSDVIDMDAETDQIILESLAKEEGLEYEDDDVWEYAEKEEYDSPNVEQEIENEQKPDNEKIVEKCLPTSETTYLLFFEEDSMCEALTALGFEPLVGVVKSYANENAYALSMESLEVTRLHGYYHVELAKHGASAFNVLIKNVLNLKSDLRFDGEEEALNDVLEEEYDFHYSPDLKDYELCIEDDTFRKHILELPITFEDKIAFIREMCPGLPEGTVWFAQALKMEKKRRAKLVKTIVEKDPTYEDLVVDLAKTANTNVKRQIRRVGGTVDRAGRAAGRAGDIADNLADALINVAEENSDIGQKLVNKAGEIAGRTVLKVPTVDEVIGGIEQMGEDLISLTPSWKSSVDVLRTLKQKITVLGSTVAEGTENYVISSSEWTDGSLKELGKEIGGKVKSTVRRADVYVTNTVNEAEGLVGGSVIVAKEIVSRGGWLSQLFYNNTYSSEEMSKFAKGELKYFYNSSKLVGFVEGLPWFSQHLTEAAAIPMERVIKMTPLPSWWKPVEVKELVQTVLPPSKPWDFAPFSMKGLVVVGKSGNDFLTLVGLVMIFTVSIMALTLGLPDRRTGT